MKTSAAASTATEHDGWVAAQVLKGATVNGELSRVSERFRPLLAHLNDMPPEKRLDGLDEAERLPWLKPELDVLTMAAARYNLGDPAPSEAAEPWPSMRLGDLPPVEPFPLDVLPPAAADLVRSASKSIGCHPDLVAAPMLGAASVAIGRSVSLMIKPGYFASAAVYVCTVDRPSSGKSPALKAATRPVSGIGKTLRRDYRREKQQWEAECQALKAGPGGKKASPPAPPVLKHIVIDNVTMEVIPHRLETSPRGLGLVKDELSALMTGLNQHKGGKGNDRQSLLDIWSGFEINKDRVGSGETLSIHCPHPFLAIVGGTQPDMLEVFLDGRKRADGLVERFLFVCPDRRKFPPFDTTGIPADVEDAWAQIIDRLWLRAMNPQPDLSLAPHVAFMSDAAKRTWKRLLDAHIDEMNAEDFLDSRAGLWGKFGEYAGRFALILALLRHAADPTADPHVVPEVDEAAIEDAWRLVAYFKSHGLRAIAIMNRGPATEDAAAMKAIMNWLQARRIEKFTDSDAQQRFRSRIEDEDRAKALARLVSLHVIRPVGQPKPTGPKVGRPAGTRYEVNPALHALNRIAP